LILQGAVERDTSSLRSHQADFTNYPYIILESKPFVANFPFSPY